MGKMMTAFLCFMLMMFAIIEVTINVSNSKGDVVVIDIPLVTEEEPVELATEPPVIGPYPRGMKEEDILTPEEIDLIALVTMAEAEGECEEGKRLVIDTILNRVDDYRFPDTVYDVIYQKNAFEPMWNGRIDRCYVMDEIVDLVKEEMVSRTNYDCVYFCAGDYSIYGTPLFKVDHHYFSAN